MATKKKKNGRQNYDWNLIKQDYVSSNLTLKKIAEKYHIRFATVKDKSRADNWFATKKEFQSKVSQKALQKLIPIKANELAKTLACVDKMQQFVETALSDEKQFNRFIVNENAPAPEGIGVVSVCYEKEMNKFDTRAMKDMLGSLKLIEEMKRSMQNIEKADKLHRQNIENERLKIEQERLALEKERLEFERIKEKERNGQVADESNVGVVIMPPIKEEGGKQ